MPQSPYYRSNSWKETSKNGNGTTCQIMECGFSTEQSSVTGAVSPRRMPLVPLSQSWSGTPAPTAPWLQLPARSTTQCCTVFSATTERAPVYQRVCSPPLVHVDDSPSQWDLSDSSPQWALSDSSPQWALSDSPQWALPDSPPHSSPEVIHLCSHCDAEFDTVLELNQHSRLCGTPAVKLQPRPFVHSLPKTIQECRILLNSVLTALPVKTAQKVVSKPPEPIAIRKEVPHPVRPRPPSKESFFDSLELRCQKMEKKNLTPSTLPNYFVNSTFRCVPFTHLPRQLRLRNNTLIASHRAESLNLEAIESNWKKIDRVCPAYPANHKKFEDFSAIRPRSFVLNKNRKGVLGAQAIALKCSLRQPRLVLRRLTAREIHQAMEGHKTHELILKYAPRRVGRPVKKTLPIVTSNRTSTDLKCLSGARRTFHLKRSATSETGLSELSLREDEEVIDITPQDIVMTPQVSPEHFEMEAQELKRSHFP